MPLATINRRSFLGLMPAMAAGVALETRAAWRQTVAPLKEVTGA